MSILHQPVLHWYDAHARDLPWRRPDASAWSVMVSEFMLQQTPVARVLPVHEQWLERWPTPADLAAEPSGEAVRAWGRLGYPRRALRLHAAATAIVERHGGEVPAAYADLLALPGVGDYTAAAIASFAFGRRHVVLDTNVRRVFARALRGVEFPAPAVTRAERQHRADRPRHWSPPRLMSRRLVLPALIALLGLAALPAVAPAAWFPAGANAPIDGPSPDIDRLGGVDLARDGTGGIVYLKRVDGTSHVFLSRFNGGQFRPPERVDNGIATGASDAVIAAADANRLAIVWTAGNSVFASLVTGGPARGRWSARPDLRGPRAGALAGGRHEHQRRGLRLLHRARQRRHRRPRQPAAGRDVDDDRRAHGHQPGRRRRRGRWPLARRRVRRGQRDRGVGEGSSLYARRVTGLNPSAAPQGLSVGDVGGVPAGAADSPEIDIEDDGSFAWAVFRQDVGGASRALARRMLGSTFDPPIYLDGGAGSSRTAGWR